RSVVGRTVDRLGGGIGGCETTSVRRSNELLDCRIVGLSNCFIVEPFFVVEPSNRRTGGCKGARFDDLTIRRSNDLPIRRYNDSTINQSIKIKHNTLYCLTLLISSEVKKLGSISSITFKKSKR